MKTIPQLMKMTHEQALRRNLIPDKFPLNRAELSPLLVHMNQEICEAHEALHNHAAPDFYEYAEDGKPEGFRFELADICILAFEVAYCSGINLYGAIKEKMAYNETRPR